MVRSHRPNYIGGMNFDPLDTSEETEALERQILSDLSIDSSSLTQHSTSLEDMPREIIDMFQEYLTPRNAANLETSSSSFFDIERLVKLKLNNRLPNSE
jgi:hypothetical protein